MTPKTGMVTGLQDEHIILRQRVAVLEHENAQLQQRIKHLERNEALNRDERFFVRGPLVFFTWVCASGWPVEYVSPNVTQLLGYQDDDFTSGRVPYSNVVHPDDIERVAAEVQLYSEQGCDIFEQEYRLIRADGNIRWIYDFTVVQRNTEGTITSYDGYIFDISERKRAEQIMQEAIQRLEFALQGSNDGVWDWNIATDEAYTSPHYKQMLGYTPDELPDTLEAWLSLIHPDDMPCVQQVLQDYLEGRRDSYEVEHRLQHKSGHWIWMLSRGKAVIRDDAGQPQRLTGTITDITTRKKIEDELRVFKAVFENASDPIAIVRASDGTITYYNEAHRAQYRCGDNHMGQSIAIIVAEEHHAHLPAILQEIVEQGVWQGQLTHVRHDGTTFPALESCFTIQDQAGEVVSMVGIVRDMTDVIAAQVQQQMIDAQRVAIRELSTPLIPLSDTVVMMPLIGTIDSTRAQMIMETLLIEVAQSQADLAILDITGVQVVDTQVAQALVQAAQAVKLLGARVMLTGIQPRIAQTLVHLGVDLAGIVTRGTLQDGIADALKNGRKSK